METAGRYNKDVFLHDLNFSFILLGGHKTIVFKMKVFKGLKLHFYLRNLNQLFAINALDLLKIEKITIIFQNP